MRKSYSHKNGGSTFQLWVLDTQRAQLNLSGARCVLYHTLRGHIHLPCFWGLWAWFPHTAWTSNSQTAHSTCLMRAPHTPCLLPGFPIDAEESSTKRTSWGSCNHHPETQNACPKGPICNQWGRELSKCFSIPLPLLPPPTIHTDNATHSRENPRSPPPQHCHHPTQPQ